MPIGIVNDEEFEKEQRDSSVIIKEIENPGRKIGDNNVPDSLRKIIGETSEIDGRQDALELAKQFGISPSSVSAYANGSTSTASYNRQPNLDHINKAKERISKKARITLRKAIENITEDKLVEAKVDVLASVARNMSAIVKDMEPEKPKDSVENKNVQFVIFSPQFKKEEHFEHIFVQDNK